MLIDRKEMVSLTDFKPVFQVKDAIGFGHKRSVVL
jgi:hypothetical protein